MKICKQEIAALVRGMGGSDPLLGIWMPTTEFAAATVPNQDDGSALLAQATPSVGNSGASTFSVSPGYTTMTLTIGGGPLQTNLYTYGGMSVTPAAPAPEPAPSFNQGCLERGGYYECSNSWGGSSGGSGGGGGDGNE